MGSGRPRQGRKNHDQNDGFTPKRCFRRVFKPESLLLAFLLLAGSSLIFVNFLALQNVKNETMSSKSSVISRRSASKGPILEILKLAGVRPRNIDMVALPSWEQVVERLGREPRIVGLETCQRYRDTVPLKLRQVAPAGMFNTGTNLLQQLLRENCEVSGRKQETLVGWQVNWGKHQSPRFRHVNYVNARIRNNSNIFPVVMVRDPWTWLQSMCKVRYSAHWFHAPEHCPNFIPNHVEREWFNKSKDYLKRTFKRDRWLVDNLQDKANFTLESKVIPVRVRYKNENAHHASLVHMWKEWNDEYLEATFPRLMVRLEDLVFFPKQVLTEICECIGGHARTRGLTLIGGTSKKGGENVHGHNKTDLQKAMISHMYTNRTAGMTRDDVTFALSVLGDSAVAKAMVYDVSSFLERAT